jgi:hypothetical protein
MTMFTNGGSIVYHQIADLPGYGPVSFNSSGIANIVSLAGAESRGRLISYVQGCFTVVNATTGRVTEFKRTPECLFAHKVTTQGIVLVQTVKENESLFTQHQVAMAKEAQRMYEMMGVHHLKISVLSSRIIYFQMQQCLLKTLSDVRQSMVKIWCSTRENNKRQTATCYH